MRKRKIFNMLGVLFVLLTGCGESLEDTYGDYAGDGKIRYIGKCSELTVKSGWNRLQAEWMNSMDAMVTNIKVSWEAAGVKYDTLLPGNATSCDIKNLADETYRVDVCGVDENGEESLSVTEYARPYSYEHEAVRSFTRIISKYYKVDDCLLFFIDNWNDSIVEANLCYTSNVNPIEEKVFPLKKDMTQQGLISVSGIDMSKPIFVTRKGKLEGCNDLIVFTNYELINQRIYSSDFKVAVQQHYGFGSENEEQRREFDHFVDTVSMLEFDYDLTSFEDILYCPQLKKVVCGRNRYLSGENPNRVDISVCTDETRSLQILDWLNEKKGVSVERYGEHYFTKMRPYIKEMGMPILPELDYISEDAIDSIENAAEEEDESLSNLLDNNPQTWWEPSVATSPRTHKILITLKEPLVVGGIKVVQRLYRPTSSSQKYCVSDQIVIEVSSDNINWFPISHMEVSVLGIGSGEATLIPMNEPRAIKYVRAILSDRINPSSSNVNYNMTLSGLVLYK